MSLTKIIFDSVAAALLIVACVYVYRETNAWIKQFDEGLDPAPFVRKSYWKKRVFALVMAAIYLTEFFVCFEEDGAVSSTIILFCIGAWIGIYRLLTYQQRRDEQRERVREELEKRDPLDAWQEESKKYIDYYDRKS